MSVNSSPGNYTRLRKKRPKVVTISARKERNLSIKKVSVILQKDESKRTKEEKEMLFNYSEIVNEATLRIEKRRQIKERVKEIEDSEAVLDAKCKQLAEAILKSEYLVAYTGAGISTAARIPDYRGAAGIWTLLQQGKDIGTHDLTQADPTFTHMALFQLYSQGKLKHIVSQNCDGLHLRSGLPKRALSEVHGNMYIEVCRTCRPIIEYLRLFDVTENTARYNHKTMRKCYKCNSSLVDSIVHFGERGNLPWPLNWKGACKAAEKADMILCIGSSLKVLKRYPWLWCMDKPAKRRPHIYIVNLQWTPKDCHARIKINGKCDIVMEKLMKYLSITVPKYSRKFDPIFEHATDLCKEEKHTTNKPFLIISKPEISETREIKSENSSLESDCKEEIKKEIKKEVPDFDNEMTENFSSQIPCVTSCKKEIVIDTGQGEDVKCVKEELIVITIRSGDDFKDCCNLFKVDQSHECGCPNFVDEQNDIPVIIQDDLLIFKNNSGFAIKEENLVDSSLLGEKTSNINNVVLGSEKSLTKMGEATTSSLSDSHFAQNFPKKENSIDSSGCKRSNEAESADNHNKRQKINDCNNDNSENKNSTVLSTKSNTKTNNGISHKTGAKQKGVDSSKDNYKCSFCSERYLSSSCLFYMKREPVFRDGVAICDCCSSEEEDENEEEKEDGNNEKINDLQKVVTNPGWYGKGFRKNIRKKR